MFTVIRSSSVARGKAADAAKWAVELANYLNENYPGQNIRAHVEWFGSAGTIHWTGEYESLAVWETSVGKTTGDAAWAALLEKGQDYFVAGSIRDLVFQQL